MSHADDLAFATIPALGARLRSGAITAVELARFFLDRLESIGPRYNCVATLTRELALKQAERADDELRDGNDRGPLHGIPYGAKDLLATRGIPTSWGCAPTRTGPSTTMPPWLSVSRTPARCWSGSWRWSSAPGAWDTGRPTPRSPGRGGIRTNPRSGVAGVRRGRARPWRRGWSRSPSAPRRGEASRPPRATAGCRACGPPMAGSLAPGRWP